MQSSYRWKRVLTLNGVPIVEMIALPWSRVGIHERNNVDNPEIRLCGIASDPVITGDF